MRKKKLDNIVNNAFILAEKKQTTNNQINRIGVFINRLRMEDSSIYLLISISIEYIIPGVENQPNFAVWDIHFAITGAAVIAIVFTVVVGVVCVNAFTVR